MNILRNTVSSVNSHTMTLNCGIEVTFTFPDPKDVRNVDVEYRMTPSLELKLRAGMFGFNGEQTLRQMDKHSGRLELEVALGFWVCPDCSRNPHHPLHFCVARDEVRSLTGFLERMLDGSMFCLDYDFMRSRAGKGRGRSYSLGNLAHSFHVYYPGEMRREGSLPYEWVTERSASGLWRMLGTKVSQEVGEYIQLKIDWGKQ